jgi:hypothetical protein
LIDSYKYLNELKLIKKQDYSDHSSKFNETIDNGIINDNKIIKGNTGIYILILFLLISLFLIKKIK